MEISLGRTGHWFSIASQAFAVNLVLAIAGSLYPRLFCLLELCMSLLVSDSACGTLQGALSLLGSLSQSFSGLPHLLFSVSVSVYLSARSGPRLLELGLSSAALSRYSPRAGALELALSSYSSRPRALCSTAVWSGSSRARVPEQELLN